MAKLAAYAAKRDFGKTAEPKGGEAAGEGSAFVVQKHDASRLHYDLRLELDGVMLSWAVAKGPSLVPGDKRLSIHVEDHPIEYNGFEGTIPKGQYGGGTVLIWDRGTWAPEGDPRRGMKKGHLDFSLAGEKLRGRFHLVRLKARPGEKQEPWLLIKSEDEHARREGDPDILAEKPLSVATGRDLPAIAAAADGAVWTSNRGDAAEARAAPAAPALPSHAEVAAGGGPRSTHPRSAVGAKRKGRASFEAALRSAPQDEEVGRSGSGNGKPPGRPDPMPAAIEPCLATLSDAVPAGGAWLHEIKWDGYRLIAFKTGAAVRLATRRGHDWTTRFPSVAAAVAALPAETAILDGEAIMEDANGVSSFSALQNALSDEHGRIARDAVFFAFDLLYHDGADLRSLPLSDRKARLADLVPPRPDGFLRLSEHVAGDGGAMVRSACSLGLEGVISKRADRPYRSGRGEDWLKLKCTERQEFVIAGYVPSSVSQKAIGSLVLGYHEEERFRHAGRAGTGFSAESARSVWKVLDGLRRKTSPFPDRLTAEERRGVVWVEPSAVAEIEFRGWTGDDHLRHAAFKGLREDKAAAEIVRERPKEKAASGGSGASSAASRFRKPSTRPRAAGEVAGVPLTHPDRVLWDEGITKQGLAEYYESVADWILPQVAGRPLSLVRCPNGAGHGCFFQKHSWAGLRDHILRDTVRDEDGEEEVLYVEDAAGLVSLVQAGVLEIHVWGSTTADIERPDRIVMDLDPGEDVPWADVIAGAQDVRERLSSLGLESFAKTTGGKGLHVVLPLTPKAGWDEAKGFAHALALAMEADSPSRYIAKASKQARRGLIYVDYLRNGRGATAIGAYSTRARPGATVSVPVAWEELGPGLKPNGYTIGNLGGRLERLRADPWAEIARVDQVLPETGGSARRARKRK